MRLSRSIVLLATTFAIGLTACSTGPAIRTDADPGANLNSYKTFGFYDRLATDRNSYTTLVSTRLKDATRRELEKRGYQYAQNPQLLVNFNVNVENRQDVRSTPAAGYYGYRTGMYGVWGGYPQDIQTVHYQQGTLTIDLVDAAKKQLVWQGVAQGRIHKKAVQNPGPAIDKAVTEIFAKFPIPASDMPAQ